MTNTLAAIVLWVVALTGVALADGTRLVVVVARGSTLTGISRSELKRCFTGESISAGGNRLIPFNAASGTPERTGFDQAVLGMSPDEVGRFWIDRKIRGQGAAPRSLPSPAMIGKVVAKFPNAIAYLPADQLTADVQPVAIDGVAYTSARYDLVAP